MSASGGVCSGVVSQLKRCLLTGVVSAQRDTVYAPEGVSDLLRGLSAPGGCHASGGCVYPSMH